VPLAEAKQLYELLLQIEGQLDTVEKRAEKTGFAVEKVSTVLQGTIRILRMMNLGEEYNQILMKLQRVILLLNMTRTAMLAVNAASMTGPAGWIVAGMGITTLALTAGDVVATVVAP